MPVYKDEKNGSWYAMVRFEDWTGQRKQKCKRGFSTKREALEWERTFQQQSAGDLDMTFEAFCELYEKDMRPRLKESTWATKDHITRTKLLPYFGKRRLCELNTKDIIAWQNTLLAYRDEKKRPYSPTYLSHSGGMKRDCLAAFTLKVLSLNSIKPELVGFSGERPACFPQPIMAVAKRLSSSDA